MRADADLPWYYGTAASTAAGDLGLRSTLGSQLEAARASRVNVTPSTLRRPGQPWRQEVSRTPEGERVHCRPSPHSVDASQVEDGFLRGMWASGRIRNIEARLAALTPAQQDVLRAHYSGASLPYGIDASARLLMAARELCGTDGHPAAEVLRRALHDAPDEQRCALGEQAERSWIAAVAAYEAVLVERSSPVQVNDPRGRR